MKPWEETWSVTPDGKTIQVQNGVGMRVMGEAYAVDRFMKEIEPERLLPRISLAASAPELYRVLKSIEWGGMDPEWAEMCPVCERQEHPYGPGHKPDCKLDAALKRARGE